MENSQALDDPFEPVLLPPAVALPANSLSFEKLPEAMRGRGGVGISGERRFAAAKDWAREIEQNYVHHISRTLEFGELVHEAKLALKRGGWEQMFREREENGVPFGKTTGKKWDAIGEVCGAIGQRPDHLSELPGSFEALYQLSRLGIELLRQAVEDGAVHSDLTEDGAREVLQDYKPELKRKPKPFKLNRFIAQTRATVAFVLAEVGDEGSLPHLLAEFQEITTMIAEAARRQKPTSPSSINSPTIQ